LVLVRRKFCGKKVFQKIQYGGLNMIFYSSRQPPASGSFEKIEMQEFLNFQNMQ
jgi:hypothetical protein